MPGKAQACFVALLQPMCVLHSILCVLVPSSCRLATVHIVLSRWRHGAPLLRLTFGCVLAYGWLRPRGDARTVAHVYPVAARPVVDRLKRVALGSLIEDERNYPCLRFPSWPRDPSDVYMADSRQTCRSSSLSSPSSLWVCPGGVGIALYRMSNLETAHGRPEGRPTGCSPEVGPSMLRLSRLRVWQQSLIWRSRRNPLDRVRTSNIGFAANIAAGETNHNQSLERPASGEHGVGQPSGTPWTTPYSTSCTELPRHTHTHTQLSGV